MSVFGDTRYGVFNVGARIYDVLTAQPFWHEQVAAVLRFAEPSAAGLEVLDLGCGPGVSTFALAQALGPPATLVGIDLAHKMVERARHNHRRHHPWLSNLRFVQADASRLLFDADSFDLAVGHSFLYLVADRAAVLGEVWRVLRPGGVLVLMEPRAGSSLTAAALHAVAQAPDALTRPRAAARFVTSMLLWRLVSRGAGRIASSAVNGLFERAGFVRVTTHPTLGGLGLHCVGHKPAASAPARSS